jgi:ADP-ribose pyrophosphatase YjhB (NUDIX family)
MIIGCITLVPLNQQWPGDFRTLAAINCAKGRGLILPGGKWEEGELFEQAAFREFKEETNQELCGLPKLFYQGFCERYNYCYTFLGLCPHYRCNEITQEGKTRWVNWSELLNSEFKAYYSLLREHVINQGFYTGN